MADKPPDAFLSYTRFDDEYHGGAISAFREELSRAVRAMTARPLEIFQDVGGIGLGENWRKRLNIALGEARFFIPILTPSFFASGACRTELQTFLQFEAESGRDDLILPIYWLRCPVLEDAGLRASDPLAEVIHERQRSNWLKLRHKPYNDPEVREALEALAEQIEQARTRALRPSPQPHPTVSKPPTKPPEPAEGSRRPGRVFRDIDQPWCPEMVEVPAGEFMMGSTEAERQWAIDEGVRPAWVEREKPQHLVRIGYRLMVGRYPVTFEEFDRFADATRREPPGDQGWGRGRRPAINVSWDDAKAYVEWLAQETGQPYRLPSEAEWEYACRAGTTTRYSWGDEITPECTNFGRNVNRTSEVGAYPANPWGLHDMHGNVWEWVEDRWHPNYEGAPNDGTAWIQGNDIGRVVRGGAWGATPRYLRAAFRVRIEPGDGSSIRGFRVARTLTGPPLRPQDDLTDAPESFEEAVKLFERRGEPMLHGWLYQVARLVRYEPGRIELQMGPGTPAGLSGRIAGALGRWTGRPWLISIGHDSNDAQETLASQAARKRDGFPK